MKTCFNLETRAAIHLRGNKHVLNVYSKRKITQNALVAVNEVYGGPPKRHPRGSKYNTISVRTIVYRLFEQIASNVCIDARHK